MQALKGFTLVTTPIVMIPARRAATRLPGKPLADIGGEAMIVHVWRRAMTAGCGPVHVATDDEEIASVVRHAGGNAVMTDPGHASGSDRIFEALQTVDPDAAHDVVINLQGDLPTLEPELIAALVAALEAGGGDIATLAALIGDAADGANPNVVKIAASLERPGDIARAHYFSRAAIPSGPGPLFHHIGIYAYRRAALERFVTLPASPLERRERLEQLRALEAGMTIDVALVDTMPLGVDTPDDLERARDLLGARPQRT